MHAITHSLAHRAPSASRSRVRWQPYNTIPSTSSSTSAPRSPIAPYLHTPPTSVLPSPVSQTPACDNKYISQPTLTNKDSSTPKNKHALGLVDQAVKSICEIWRPQDIPSAFATPPSITSHADVSGLHLKQLRNTQPPSPSIPTTNASIRPASTNQVPARPASDARSSQVHIKGFVHEVLRRSKTSGCVLQTALCYLEAIRSKVPELLALERQGLGVKGEPTPTSQVVPATEAEIEYEAAIASITSNDIMDTVRITEFFSCSETIPQSSLTSVKSNDGQGNQKPKLPTAPVTPLPPLPSPLLCPRRAFLASLILASKFTQDKCYSNRAWAKLSGLPAREIGRCERALGEALEWRLWVGKTSVTPASSQQRPVIRSQSEGSIGLPSTQARNTSTASSSCFPNGNRCLRRVPSLPSIVLVTQPPVHREANFMDSSQELSAAHATYPIQYTQTDVVSHKSATATLQGSFTQQYYPGSFTSEISRTPSPDLPGLSYSPSSTESSSSGERTIQMSTFLDDNMAPPFAETQSSPWMDGLDPLDKRNALSLDTARLAFTGDPFIHENLVSHGDGFHPYWSAETGYLSAGSIVIQS